MKKEILIVFLFALLFTLPVLIANRFSSFKLDSDYDMGLPLYHFISDYVRSYRSIHIWNPYIGTGISVIGDPTSMILNPFAIIPIVLFGEGPGMRILIALTIIMSGISMWIFLTIVGIKGVVRIWGSILYEVSGPLAAAIAAGHGGKILTYPFIPLFLALTISPKVKKINILLSSVVLSLVFFSGDFYTLWFFVIISSIKLMPFIKDVNPQMARFFPIDPYAGSIHAFLSPLAFIIPFGVEFYDRPFFQRTLGFHFNWYEYFAFISPLPFIFLLRIKKVLKKEIIIIFLLIIFVGMLYISLKYPYSPFYWLYKFFPLVQSFRVPQRIFTPITAVLIALFAMCAKDWLKNTKLKKKFFIIYTILILSVGWTFFVNQQTLVKAFDAPRKEEEAIAKELRKKDNSSYYVVTFVCCTQTFLIREKIPILNFYYGWRPKGTPNFINKKGDGYDFSVLKNVKPKYIISDNNKNFSEYSYYAFLENSKIRIWKTDKSNIFPKL